jgi:hypothetical protein
VAALSAAKFPEMVMELPDDTCDSGPAKFSILALCESCQHQRVLDLSRLDPDQTIPALRTRLSCQESGTRHASLRFSRPRHCFSASSIPRAFLT